MDFSLILTKIAKESQMEFDSRQNLSDCDFFSFVNPYETGFIYFLARELIYVNKQKLLG